MTTVQEHLRTSLNLTVECEGKTKMKKLNKKLKLHILQIASSGYLTEPLPDDWFNLSESEQEHFLEENAWEPFEYWPTSEVYDVITAAAYNIEFGMEYFINMIKEVDTGVKPR